MLKAEYTKILKERGLKGIKHPLILDDNKKLFYGKYLGAAGLAPWDDSFFCINLAIKNRTKVFSRLEKRNRTVQQS